MEVNLVRVILLELLELSAILVIFFLTYNALKK